MGWPHHQSRASALILVVALVVAALFLQTPAAGGQEAEATPHPPADRLCWMVEASRDPTLAPWQREFMLGLVESSHDRAVAERTPGLVGLADQSTRTAADDGTWSPIPPPSGRTDHTAIYDPVRHRMLVFGGWDGRFRNDVWALSLSESPAWTSLAPSGTAPTGRWGSAAIYDPVRDRLVVIGGYDGTYRNDAWALQLSGSPAWSVLSPAGVPPSAREEHTAVYDPVGDRIVVFGGVGTSGYRNDVWGLTLSGNPAWSSIVPAGTPPTARHSHAAIYDPLRGRMLVFGGLDASSRPSDVLALTFSESPTWTALAPAGTPAPGREDCAALYDPVRDRMVVFGGWLAPLGGYDNDVWTLSLSGSPSWSSLALGGSLPSPRHSHTAVYDPVHNLMLVFGGQDGSRPNEVWGVTLSDGPVWSVVTPAPPLVGRRFHTAIHDPVRDRMVVYGGYGPYAIPPNEVWALSLAGDHAWSMLIPAGSPPPVRFNHTAINDPVRDRMLVFGGLVGLDTYSNEVWALSLAGSPVWSALATVGTPPTGREGPSAIYDPVRDQMVVFGGLDGINSYRNDVWALSLAGSPTWSALAPLGTPPTGRSLHTAMYDPVRDRMVVFGGAGFGVTGDVLALTLSGDAAWIIVPAGGPPDWRYGHAAIHDPVRDRMVVFGGVPASDAWALTLSGSPGWSRLAPAGLPPSERSGHTAVYDPLRDRVVIFGGFDGSGDRNDLWVLGWGQPPVPTLVSLSHAEADPDRVSLAWYGSESAWLTASVERREETTGCQRLATISADGTGTFRYDDRAVRPGVRYAYRLAYRDGDGAEVATAETWVDVPVTVSLALEGLRPNPAGDEWVVVFALPDDAHASLAMLDITGRQVLAREVGSLGAGRHTLRLAHAGALPAGIYWLHLERMGVARLAKAIILR